MADAYEREAMPGVGEVLHRQKVTSPKWAMIVGVAGPVVPLVGLSLAFLFGGQILAGLGALAGAAAALAGMTFVMVTFATARIAVSEGELHLQLGMAGPRIAIADIASVSLAPSGSNRYGMGMRKDFSGVTTYTLWGRNDRAVHIETTAGKKLVIVCKEPDALAQALEEAMARKAGRAPRVRVADVDAEAAVERDEPEAAAKKRARAE